MDQHALSNTLLRLSTFNIKNIRANSIYTKAIGQNLDLLALQEHWLFRFEEEVLGTLLPDFNFHIKCVDDNDPLSPKNRIRGYGGVAIGWKAHLNHVVKKIPDGGNRIAVITVRVHQTPLIVKSCNGPMIKMFYPW